MFSPYYAWTRRHGAGDPLGHCALNVALYGPRGRWALTERGRGVVRREANHLAIGPSALSWDGNALLFDIDEVTAPIPARLRGRVRVHPSALTGHTVPLDAAGRHRWSPLAPCARVEVELDRPSLRWSGHGYLDSNSGNAPLEADFARWDWSCARLPDGAAILYDVSWRDGGGQSVALRIDRAGRATPFPPPPPVVLPRTRWGVERRTRAEDAARARRTLLDAPFYARSVLQARLLGESVTAMHESLDLGRFASPWVQAMLPFQMPRAVRGTSRSEPLTHGKGTSPSLPPWAGEDRGQDEAARQHRQL